MESLRSFQFVLLAVLVASLAACGGPQNPAGLVPASTLNASAAAVAKSTCPLQRCIIVANAVSGHNGTGSIVFFARNAHGNKSPVNVIAGSLTKLNHPIGITLDSDGTAYAANFESNSITVYAAGASGDSAPIRTIAGTKTGLLAPAGIVLDSAGELLVANNKYDSITIYAAKSNGNISPTRTISGNKTMLSHPWGIALDSKSNIYVSQGTSIAIFAANAKGNAAPERMISGSLTQLGEAEGIAVDAKGYTYVADWGTATLDVFAPEAEGDQAPVRQDTSGL
ncbi:MAG TPA: beta-propeller fold lactonase family protein [Candidatus Tumulicola sp.]|jgi:hypothetical protein